VDKRPQYERHRPEQTSLYAVVRDNIETLYGAIDEGALDVRLPKHARKELDAYLDCGLLCRGFARLRCDTCEESRLVAFSCKGRGFCPSCVGRRMCATAAHLIEEVLPAVGLRQWVLTFPFPWRKRLAHDGALLGRLTRIFVESANAAYAKRAEDKGAEGGKTGSVTVIQRTSSDMRLNPHLHVVFLDGVYREHEGDLTWNGQGHLQTREVADVLVHAVKRMKRHLERGGLLELGDDTTPDDETDADRQGALLASAVSGQAPPAGPQWLRGLRVPTPRALAFDKPLCASLDGFTLHAATKAGGLDVAGREALLRYVLRPPLAQDRVELLDDGLVRIALKRAYADGTVAVDMDPLSLLCRLAASVPPPRHHVVRYSGVLASASPCRKLIAPKRPEAEEETPAETNEGEPKAKRSGSYWPWADLLRRTFDVDVLDCPKCHGRMKLLAMVTEAESITRFLKGFGEPLDVPARAPNRGPPFWASTVLRQKSLGTAA